MTTTTPAFGLLHDFRQRAPFSQGYGSYYAECLAKHGRAITPEARCAWAHARPERTPGRRATAGAVGFRR